jgi:GAF domain-containing protein
VDQASDDLWLRRLLEVGRSLVTELDLKLVLDRVLETAREITGARYAAIGVLNERRTELAQFLTSGIEEDMHRRIGDLPRGRGVLGVLIEHPEPLRLSDVGAHPRSYGFPVGHPVMRSFLGVPVVVRGETWGNLYLTEKEGGEFSERDQQAAIILADWAAVAINNARVYETSELRRHELEKAVLGLEATRDVAVAIGGEIALEHVLELIAKRGRALVGARSLVIMLRDEEELVVHASAGHAEERRGARLPIAGSTSGQVLERGRAERITDVDARLGIAPTSFGVVDARTALLVPMLYRGEGVGVLAAFDRGEDGASFTEEHEQMLRTFAASAATAVALAQSVLADRLRAAIESLLDRYRQQSGLEIEHEVAVRAGANDGESRLDSDLETAAYRLVQEGITNVVKHAHAKHVRVMVAESDGELFIEVQDDGAGFDPATVERGFGLDGMSERVSLAGGSLKIGPCDGGTLLSARMPARRASEAAERSRADQTAS